MTLVTEALDRAARQCSVTAPSSWITATDDEHVEVRDDFLMETVDDILERVDLPSPIGAQTTIAGDGNATYALPSDFKRLARDKMAVYDITLDRIVCPVTSDGEWSRLTDIGPSGERYYRLTGYDGNWSITFEDAVPTGTSIVVSYVTTSWAINGTAKASLSDPDDVLLLPRRVVEAGIVWRWRERKGLPFQDKMMEYEALIARLSNDTRGRRTINMGERREVRWQDQIPNFIPS